MIHITVSNRIVKLHKIAICLLYLYAFIGTSQVPVSFPTVSLQQMFFNVFSVLREAAT